MKNLKIFLGIVIMLIMVGIATCSHAKVITEEDINEFANKYLDIEEGNVTTEDIVAIYDDLLNEYTNDDIADTIDNYKEDLRSQGVDEESIKTITSLLKTTNTEDMKKILKDVDFKKLTEEIANKNQIDNVLNTEAVKLLVKLFFANKIIKTTMFITFALTAYMFAIKWIIYKKAGKHGWAALIPIYRKVVWLQMAGLSPWLLLLYLLPIIGWIILEIIFIVSYFKLPQKFGESAIWGLGIWFIPIVFLSIMAFSKEFEYKENKEIEEK